MLRALASVLVGLAMLGACSTIGTVQLDGHVASASVREIRYAIHPTYGLSQMDLAMSAEALVRDDPYVSMFPDAQGRFTTGEIGVSYHSPPLSPPDPPFWISFSNERDVLYGVGPGRNGFDYATWSVEGDQRIDRATTCWIVRSGEFTRPTDRSVILSIIVVPNLTTNKQCIEPSQ